MSRWEKMKFTEGNIDLDHFWYTNFWVPEPPPPPALLFKYILGLPKPLLYLPSPPPPLPWMPVTRGCMIPPPFCNPPPLAIPPPPSHIGGTVSLTKKHMRTPYPPFFGVIRVRYPKVWYRMSNPL